MRVIWSELAEAQLERSIAFVSILWGEATGQQLLRESRRISRLLALHPRLGHPEPLLAERPQGYRSIVIGRYNKLIYFITEKEVRIAALWDTRRAPEALTDEVG